MARSKAVFNESRLAKMMVSLYPVIFYFLERKAAEKGYFRMRAAQMIDAYKEHALYIAVVPDDSGKLEQFFAQGLAHGPGSDVLGWDTTGWGYLCWHDVEGFCKKNEMTNTLRVFKFNEGQIY